ncbi:hypothetical protein ACLB2K_040043 [Fragaria x ananassa]
MGSLCHADYEIAPVKTNPPLDSRPLSDDTEVIDDDTQAVCLAGETQVMDLGGETQLLDGFDCIGDMETQLLDLDDRVVSDSEGEESDATQVLDVDEDVEEEVSMRRGEGQLVVEERTQCGGSGQQREKRLMQQESRLVDEEHNAGYVRMHFTSVRAASLRASGLAARNNSGSRYSLEHLATVGGEEDNQGNDMGRNNDKVKSSRVCSSTVRKLFTVNPEAEIEGFPHESNSFEECEDLLLLPSCDLAGLSYADSQEPGELSQANALNFVDKFLQDNVEEFDKEGECRKSSKKISKVVSSAKGPQILAKKANEISLVTDAGIYEWDDNREDEGGGELFRRKRTDFFSGGSHGSKSLPQPRKAKRNRADEPHDNKQTLQGKNKIVGAVHSDSKLLVQNSKASEVMECEDEMRHKRNLTNEFDEQFNMCSTRGQLDAHVNKPQVPEMLNVGFDTQIAAEAMEALFNDEGISNCEVDNAIHRNSPEGSMGEKMKNTSVKKPPSRKRAHLSDAGVDCRKSQQAKKTRRVDPNSIEDSSIAPLENSKNARKPHESALVITKSKKAKSRAANHVNINQRKVSERTPSVSIDRGTEGSKKQNLQHSRTFTPIACRTRQSMLVNQFNEAENPSSDCGDESNNVMEDVAGVQLSENSSKLGLNQASRVGNTKQNQNEHADVNFEAVGNGVKLVGLSFPRGRRSRRIMSSKVHGPGNLDVPSEPSIQPEKFGNYGTRRKRSQEARSTTVDNTFKRETRSSTRGSLVNKNLEENCAQKNLDKGGCDGSPPHCNSSHDDGKTISEKIIVEKTVRVPDRFHDARSFSVKMMDESPRQKGSCQQSDAACTTPVNHNKVAVNDASPVCMGNEYFKQSCKRSLSRPSLLKELRDLSPLEYEPTSASKDLRRRRDMTDVRVLYSHHLDEDIIKKQKKVLGRLGVSVASSMTDATHFIADQFVRTRNMLEAIAFGKPVVTHLWLESCGQANRFIDEKTYILRDSKKEKEFGFSMPASLARACQYPLLKILQDRKVFITPSTKPGKETISSLVKAVNGQAVERIGRFALTANQIPDNLLVISCEEDYEICVPLLEKGAAVYSSELVLNGIVTQRLEFERHRLFTDQVKKTRSTIWLRKDDSKFQPVSKK